MDIENTLNYKFKNTLGSLVNKVVMVLAIVSASGAAVSILFNVFTKKGKKSSQAQA